MQAMWTATHLHHGDTLKRAQRDLAAVWTLEDQRVSGPKHACRVEPEKRQHEVANQINAQCYERSQHDDQRRPEQEPKQPRRMSKGLSAPTPLGYHGRVESCLLDH